MVLDVNMVRLRWKSAAHQQYVYHSKIYSSCKKWTRPPCTNSIPVSQMTRIYYSSKWLAAKIF